MRSASAMTPATDGAGSKVWELTPSGTTPRSRMRVPPIFSAMLTMGETVATTFSAPSPPAAGESESPPSDAQAAQTASANSAAEISAARTIGAGADGRRPPLERLIGRRSPSRGRRFGSRGGARTAPDAARGRRSRKREAYPRSPSPRTRLPALRPCRSPRGPDDGARARLSIRKRACRRRPRASRTRGASDRRWTRR